MVRKAHDGVVIRRQQLLFISVFVGLFALMAYGASLQQPITGAWHTLENVTMTHASGPNAGKGNLTSVDGNQNGIIDNAEFAQLAEDSRQLTGISGSQFSKGCVVADTGTGGNSFTGWSAVDLRISSENICADGDGCTYRIVRYNANCASCTPTTFTPENVYYASPYAFFQFPDNKWIDFDEKTGTNGDGTYTRITRWPASATLYPNPWLEVKDDTAAENTNYQLSVNDNQNNHAFVFTMCD